MPRIIVVAGVSTLGILAVLAGARAIRGGEQALRGPYVGSYTATLTSAQAAALGHGRLRFYDDRFCKLGGLERPQGGIYRWSLNGRRLTLSLVNEGACTGRTDTLTFPVWARR